MDINDIAGALAETQLFEEELAPYLEELESSSGTILVEELPPFPATSLGLVVQRHTENSWFISYDCERFACLKQMELYHDTVVFQSLCRWLDNIEPTGTKQLIEVTLWRLLLCDEQS